MATGSGDWVGKTNMISCALLIDAPLLPRPSAERFRLDPRDDVVIWIVDPEGERGRWKLEKKEEGETMIPGKGEKH